jgi:predicted cupin superfamily sugar epimerase
MKPHPEGGFYREVYRSAIRIPVGAVKASGGRSRSLATSIYFLLDGADYSSWHRLSSDELWYFHEGASVRIHRITPEGRLTVLKLGPGRGKDEVPQRLVPAGHWIAAELERSAGYALLSCSVFPGFEFDDFEMASAEDIFVRNPKKRARVGRLLNRRGGAPQFFKTDPKR